MSTHGLSRLSVALSVRKALQNRFLTGGAAVVLSSAALAQQVAEGPSALAQPTVIEEIVVTAEKRPERLQDAPVAVSVVSGAQLSDMQIEQSTSLVSAVPSLTFQQGANPGEQQFPCPRYRHIVVRCGHGLLGGSGSRRRATRAASPGFLQLGRHRTCRGIERSPGHAVR